MKRKSFMKTGWFQAEVDVPNMPDEIEEYFDHSFITNLNQDTLVKVGQTVKRGITLLRLENTADNTYRELLIVNDSAQFYPNSCLSSIKIKGGVDYQDSEGRHFSWPINNFRNWPKKTKIFTLKFIKALENAYYSWAEVDEAQLEKENNYKKELEAQSLENVETFFGEIMK